MHDFNFPRPVRWVGECCHPVPVHKGGKPRTNYPEPIKKGDYCGVKLGSVRWPAHRLSYSLNKESVPNYPGQKREGLVLHTCDHKWCVNPDHLYLGTSKQNAQDNAARNPEWRRKRSEIQKLKGAPVVSPEGRARTAAANRINTAEYFRNNPEIAKERCAKMRAARWGK